MKLIQVNDINCGSSFPIESNKSLEELRNIYGSQNEGETITIYDDNGNRHSWLYKNKRYFEI